MKDILLKTDARYRNTRGDLGEYILLCTKNADPDNNEYMLFCPVTMNRWRDAVPIRRLHNPTEEELKGLFGNPEEWEFAGFKFNNRNL